MDRNGWEAEDELGTHVEDDDADLNPMEFEAGHADDTAAHGPDRHRSEIDLVDDATRRAAKSERRSPKRRDLSVILPTYNEAENLPILLDRLIQLLADVDHEIIVVDDNSPDGTWQVAADYAERWPRIRSIRRTHDRGLSSAVLAGMQVAEGRALAVMDSDLQHDEQALLDVVAPILAGDADVSLGSREADGGSYGEWSKWRRFVSWGGKQMARRLLGTPVSDPMSGFFAVSRERFNTVAGDVNPRGFKILLEFLARGPRPRTAEVGYEFRDRVHGATKLSGSVVGAYLLALLDLVVGRLVSASFTAYALVGAVGVIVRYSLFPVFLALGIPWAALLAFEASVLSNYWLNNRFTFVVDRRFGSRLFTGLIPFHLVAAHGLVVQAGVVSITDTSSESLFGGAGLAQLFGILIATTGNYFLNRTITWRRPI